VQKNRTSPIRPSVSRSDALRSDRILVDTFSPGSRNERRNLSDEPFPCHPGVVEVRLGDEVDGFLAEETVRSVSEIVPWLEEAIAHLFAASSYVQSLSPEVHKRAAIASFTLLKPPRPSFARTAERRMRHRPAWRS